MNRRFDSEHESGSTRTAFEALRAARPCIPTELTSVDTEEADDVFWRIVGDEPNPRVGRHRFRRSHFTLAVTAAAAAAVIGVLVTLPNRGTPVSVGEGLTTQPEVTAEPAPVATEAVDATALWPEIAPSPPVGELMTARANMIVSEQFQQSTLGPNVLTMADGDVNIGIPFQPPAGGAMDFVDNRYVVGEWYFRIPEPDGDGMQWSYDPNDTPIFVGVSPADPRELYERLAPSSGFEADGTDFVLGVETVRLVATTPEAIDPLMVQYQPFIESVVSLELWIDSNGIVRRIDVTAVMPPVLTMGTDGVAGTAEESGASATVSVEFYDIGEPITVDVPRDAIEIDGQG